MPLAKNRELIAISSQAHEHLKTIVAAMKGKGIPTSGTLIASQVILSIPIPQAQAVGKKRRRSTDAVSAPVAAV